MSDSLDEGVLSLPVAPEAKAKTSAFQHPRAFYVIFSLELWERFGFYGLQAVLASFFVKSLGMGDKESFAVFGAFSAMVYGFVAIGGFIGDKVLGTKRTLTLGALTLMTGYLLMGLASARGHVSALFVFAALATVAVGNGLFKANPSSLLSKLYSKDDPRLDGAFTLYYMAVNIGSFASTVLVPFLGGRFGNSLGFYVCAVGLVLSLASFAFFRRLLKGVDSPVGLAPLRVGRLVMVLAGILCAIALGTYMLTNLSVAHALLLLVGLSVLGVFGKEIAKSSGSERRKMIAALILMVEAVLFFVLYQQMPTSLNFYAIKNVNPYILGIHVTNAESFQALNPFWIMVISPLCAFLYAHYGDKGKDLSMPGKFALGMSLCAVSFLMLPVGSRFANQAGVVSAWWLVGSYFFQSVGELLISGLGLAMVAKLVPERMMGFIMGAWFLTTAASGVIGGWVAGLTAAPKGLTSSLETLAIYSNVFLKIGLVSAAIALLMIATAGSLRRMIEKED